MDDRFLQQLKKGVLEMLVLALICAAPAYGYEILQKLKDSSCGLFVLKEGTLYPILYRLEDDGMIESSWFQGKSRAAPKKIYTATEQGRREYARRKDVWTAFAGAVESFIKEVERDETQPH